MERLWYYVLVSECIVLRGWRNFSEEVVGDFEMGDDFGLFRWVWGYFLVFTRRGRGVLGRNDIVR